jgi:hypothetical protein
VTNAAADTAAPVGSPRLGQWHLRARVVVSILLALWVVAGVRRSVSIERTVPRGATDPYGTTGAVGAERVDPIWYVRLATIRRVAALAGDAHDADTPALIVAPTADSLAALFLLFQLAHVWYPQPVAATAGSRRMGVASALARPALLYVIDGGAPAIADSALVPVARLAPFTAYRITR